jgi:sialate O-acetylesterase
MKPISNKSHQTISSTFQTARGFGGLSAAALMLLSFSSFARAEVRLAALFSDNMVLQQGMPAPVWGWADDGEEVKVTFRGKSVSAKAKNGKWMVKLAALKAGGPEVLIVEGKNRIELHNVLVGEVWICSGQSNMELALKQAFEADKDIAGSANPQLRLFHVPKVKANEPTNDVHASWKESAPETTPDFSAVAYYFGRDLQKARNVPVGLIETCWGGSPAEVWMSQAVLEANPEYKRDILEAYQRMMAAMEKQETKNRKGARVPWKPTELYNGMIAPLIPYAMKGAIWYQGESNASRAQQYRSLFADMIRNWRKDWGEGDFTFLEVQLAPYDKGKKRSLEDLGAMPVESDWAELREAQLLATEKLPKVGMAVITDVGEKDDIHPKKKEPVGARLVLAARGIAYGEKIEYSGPLYKSMKVHGDKAVLTFEHVDGGLEARDGQLKGFAICGPDKKFVWAKAQIDGDKIAVSSPDVKNPMAVRYGWSDYPVVNLWNKDGLPASPFRTDDFPMTTARKEKQP